MTTNTDTTAASGAASQVEALDLAECLEEIGRIKDHGRPPVQDVERRAAVELRRLHADCQLLADILNRRPALNAGLDAAYSQWTAEVYYLMGAMSTAPANSALAAPATQEAEPAGWMNPATSDVITAAPTAPAAEQAQAPGGLHAEAMKVWADSNRLLGKMLGVEQAPAAGAAPTDAEIADVSLEYVGQEPLSDFDYVAFARAVLARWGAAAPAQEADGWMPIETAPKDGTEIDLFNRGGHREAGAFWGLPPHECGEMGRYCDSDWHGYEPGWVTDFWGEPQPDSNFSHWRRKPAPPSARARQEGGS